MRGLRRSESLRVPVLAVFLTGVFGISFAAIFVRLALPAPPVVAGFHRMWIATAVIGVAFGLRRGGAAPARSVLLAIAAGACFGTDLALWNTSIVLSSVATSTLLVNTTPILVGLFSVLVLREPLGPRFAAGAALALAGAAVLVGLPSSARDSLEGALLALAAAVFYSGYLLLMAAARRALDTLPALFAASTSASAVLGLYALVRGDPFAGFPAASWAAILGLALVSQVGGVLGIVWALRFLPAMLASVVLLGQPVVAALLGWALLGEAIGPLQALGGGAVLAGIALCARAR
jgi:drug/metabolite transporter (DMT)-like permease